MERLLALLTVAWLLFPHVRSACWKVASVLLVVVAAACRHRRHEKAPHYGARPAGKFAVRAMQAVQSIATNLGF